MAQTQGNMEKGAVATVPKEQFLERHNLTFVKQAKYIVVGVFSFFFFMFGCVFFILGVTCNTCKFTDAEQSGYTATGPAMWIMSIIILGAYTLFRKYTGHNKARYTLISMLFIVLFMAGLTLVSVTDPSVSEITPLTESALKAIGIVMTVGSGSMFFFIIATGICDATDC